MNSGLIIARALTWRYLIALTLVATLSTAAWISLRLVISEQKSTAAIVNVSGRQRMLSQRTALFSSRLLHTPEKDRAEIRRQLEAAADLMQRSHLGLTRGNPEMGLPSTMSPTVHAMYFDGPDALDRQVEEYLDAVRTLLRANDEELTPDNPQLHYIITVSPTRLVSSLDKMVSQYQREGEEAIGRLQKAETLLWLFTLLLLALEAAFIFRPFASHIKTIIAELRKTTNSLYESRERLRIVTENANDWLWETDAEGVVTNFSSRSGPSEIRDGVVGRNLASLLDPAQPSGGAKQMLGSIEARSSYRDIVFPLRVDTGKSLWVRASGVPKQSKSGNFIGYLGVWTDITESKRLEDELHMHQNHLEELVRQRTADLQKKSEALAESEEKFRLISSSAKEAILIIGQSEEIAYCNPAAETIFGYTAGEALGKNLHDLLAPLRYRDDIRKGFEHFCVSGEGPMIGKTVEMTALRKGGQEFPIELSISAVKMQNEWHALGVIRDITERKKTEMQLRELNETLEQRVEEAVHQSMEHERMLIQQSRLAAMGEMIGNIAHQWRQPLNALALLQTNVKDDFEYGELNQENMNRFVEEGQKIIQKMSSTIDDFRDFFKPQKEKKAFLIHKIVKHTLVIVNAGFKNHNIAVTIKEEPDIQVVGYPNELSQVLLNVLNNAKDALLDRNVQNGKIDIAMSQDKDTAWITVRDNAGGITPETLPKIFDPYFTTREKGTGIGLYMSRMIMEHMNGSIDMRNIEGGAEFKLTMPKNQA
ncbi:MAG TPA: PAS domain S-box protein [Sulfuricella sp.]|nr:PAS domain S-box protein [Sulfuricella sp.]